MSEIRNLTRNGETFYPLTCTDAIVNRDGNYAIDEEPAVGSDNLVKSGGVAAKNVEIQNLIRGFYSSNEAIQNILSYFSADNIPSEDLRLDFFGIHPTTHKFMLGLINSSFVSIDYVASDEAYDTIPQSGHKIFRLSGLRGVLRNVTIVINWGGFQGTTWFDFDYATSPVTFVNSYTSDLQKSVQLVDGITKFNYVLTPDLKLTGSYFRDGNPNNIYYNPEWGCARYNVTSYRGKILRIASGNLIYKHLYTSFSLENNSYILISNYFLYESNDLVLVKVPNNATYLNISCAITVWDTPVAIYSSLENLLLDNLFKENGYVYPSDTETGFWYNLGDSSRSVNVNWASGTISLIYYRNRNIKLRFGYFNNPVAYCWVVKSDNSEVSLESVVSDYGDGIHKKFYVSENMVTLKVSWQCFPENNRDPINPIFKEETGTNQNIYGLGYQTNDPRYSKFLSALLFDIPSDVQNHDLRLFYCGIFNTNHQFYIAVWDLIENKRVGYWVSTTVYDIIPEGLELFEIDTWMGINTSYSPGKMKLLVNWDFYEEGMWLDDTSFLTHPKIFFSENTQFEYLLNKIMALYPAGDQGYFDIQEDRLALPSQIFLRSDREIPLYKNSMVTYTKEVSKIDIQIKNTKQAPTGRKVFEINDPTYFKPDDFSDSAQLFISRALNRNKLYFKNLKVFKKDITQLQGKTLKILSLGDSLTEGRVWGDTPVTMLAQDLEELGVTTQFIGSLVRDYIDNHGNTRTIRYEGHGGWRYRTLVGLESKFSDLNVIIPSSQTKHEWVLGVDGPTMNSIKANNAFLYPATLQDLQNYPNMCFHFVEGSTVYNKSYAEDSTLGSYVIFDPTRYFSMRQIEVPDVVTIAFATNEWYLNLYGGFDNQKIGECIKFIIEAFRRVSSSLKIVVIPQNNFPTSRESDWEDYCTRLTSNTVRICDELIESGDNNLFVCPIWCQGSRTLAFNGTTGTATNVDSETSLKQITIDDNVHMLYENDESNWDYRDSLSSCIVNLIN